jgi:hypothetical protein
MPWSERRGGGVGRQLSGESRSEFETYGDDRYLTHDGPPHRQTKRGKFYCLVSVGQAT